MQNDGSSGLKEKEVLEEKVVSQIVGKTSTDNKQSLSFVAASHFSRWL